LLVDIQDLGGLEELLRIGAVAEDRQAVRYASRPDVARHRAGVVAARGSPLDEIEVLVKCQPREAVREDGGEKLEMEGEPVSPNSSIRSTECNEKRCG
jgi:hypothetical protein